MKIASRYLLLLEIYLSITMLSWGWSGWRGEGMLWSALHDTGQNVEWGVVMLIIGLSQLTASSGEWLMGRYWCNRTLLLNVSNRMVCLFLQTAVWFYVCYVIATLPGMDMVSALWIQAPAALVFSALAFAGNMKVRLVLHPKIPTANLERTIIVDRSKLMRW